MDDDDYDIDNLLELQESLGENHHEPYYSVEEEYDFPNTDEVNEESGGSRLPPEVDKTNLTIKLKAPVFVHDSKTTKMMVYHGEQTLGSLNNK